MDEASETVFKLLRRSKTLSSAQLTRFFDAVRGTSNEELLRQFRSAKKKKTASAKAKKATNPRLRAACRRGQEIRISQRGFHRVDSG